MTQTNPPVTEEAVERVARALAKNAGEHWFVCDRYSKENERWVKAAQAAIAALTKSPPVVSEGWQPIETAPKNGGEILAWIHGAGGGRVTTIEWCLATWQWVESYDLEGWSPEYGPTHWQPLPEPPPAMSNWDKK